MNFIDHFPQDGFGMHLLFDTTKDEICILNLSENHKQLSHI